MLLIPPVTDIYTDETQSQESPTSPTRPGSYESYEGEGKRKGVDLFG